MVDNHFDTMVQKCNSFMKRNLIKVIFIEENNINKNILLEKAFQLQPKVNFAEIESCAYKLEFKIMFFNYFN